MKISAIQMNSGQDKAANLAAAHRLAEVAVAADRPDMLVFPETFTSLGGTRETRRANAEALPATTGPYAGDGGDAYTMLRTLAKDHGVFVHGGSFLERDGDDYFNTTIAFDRQGLELARYRKIHLFDVTTRDGVSYRESDTFSRGDQVVTYQADGVTVGCSICYDLRFAELYIALAKAGAQVIMAPAAFTLNTGKDHWEVLVRARAIETQCYVVAPAHCGKFKEDGASRYTWGHSMIVDPWGHILAQTQDTVGHATATLDLAYQADVRDRIPVANHRVL